MINTLLDTSNGACLLQKIILILILIVVMVIVFLTAGDIKEIDQKKEPQQSDQK